MRHSGRGPYLGMIGDPGLAPATPSPPALPRDVPTMRLPPAAGARSGAPCPPVPTPWTRRDALTATLAVVAFWLAAALAWRLAGGVVPWDSKNHFYPMFPPSRGRARAGRVAAVEPLPLQRAPGRGRSAVPALHADHAPPRPPRPRGVDGGVRPRRVRPSPAAGFRGAGAVRPARLAAGGRGRGGDDDRARRLGRRASPAHRHDLQLRLLPAGARLPRIRPAPPRFPAGSRLRGVWRADGAGTRSGRLPRHADAGRLRPARGALG